MQKMLKNPYGKNWEVSSFYTIYCVAEHAKNTIYCDIPVCNSLKILSCKRRTGSTPVSGTSKTGEIHNNFSRFVMFGKRLGSKFLLFLPKNRQFLLILLQLHNS